MVYMTGERNAAMERWDVGEGNSRDRCLHRIRGEVRRRPAFGRTQPVAPLVKALPTAARFLAAHTQDREMTMSKMKSKLVLALVLALAPPSLPPRAPTR